MTSHVAVEVTQADREAAADLIEAYWQGSGEKHDEMRKCAQSYRNGHTQGVWAHAFARHRLTTTEPPSQGASPRDGGETQRETDAITEMYRRYCREGEFTIGADVKGSGRVTIAVSRYAAIVSPQASSGTSAAGEVERLREALRDLLENIGAASLARNPLGIAVRDRARAALGGAA